MKISIKSSLVQRKFYFNLFFIFIFHQFLIGIIFSYHPIGNENTIKLYYFIRNLLSLSLFIWSYFFLLKLANTIGHTFYIKTKKFLFIYFIISLVITCFYYGTPFTLFSYLGYCITEIFVYQSYYGPIYFTLNYLFTETYI